MIKVTKNGEQREVPNKVYDNYMQFEGWEVVEQSNTSPNSSSFKELMAAAENEDEPSLRIKYLYLLAEIRNTKKVQRMLEETKTELENLKIQSNGKDQDPQDPDQDQD